jgi:hypothetical protein
MFFEEIIAGNVFILIILQIGSFDIMVLIDRKTSEKFQML